MNNGHFNRLQLAISDQYARVEKRYKLWENNQDDVSRIILETELARWVMFRRSRSCEVL